METSETAQAISLMLNPGSMAVVGASDRQPAWEAVIGQNEASGTQVYLVNPNRDEVFGRKAYRSLLDIPAPVDAVLSLVNAELTVDVVDQAARVGARSVVITAAGFGETDDAGKERQQQIVSIADAHNMAICGPNCTGFMNVVARKSLCGRPVAGIRAGGVALISHSGGLITAAIGAGAERKLGFSYLISSGNEAVTDLAAYLDVLVDDPLVTAIAMVVEEIRRPAEFIDAAYRARAAGKPLLALKLGRSEVGQRIGASHTGAMMGNSRDYDALFRQLGVAVAEDFDDLLDLTLLFSSLPREQWLMGDSVGVLCASGGSAGICSDAFDAEHLPLVLDERLTEWMRDLIPTNALGNPFDTTGLLYNENDFETVLAQYLTSTVYDTVFVASSGLGPPHEQLCTPLTGPLQRAAATGAKRLIITSSSASVLGDWTDSYLEAGIGLGRGIVPTVRSLRAMDRFVRGQNRSIPDPVLPLPRPNQLEPASDGSNQILRFGDGARLAAHFGLPIAPFVEIDEKREDIVAALATLPPASHYVVKLANSLHRSDIGAVQTNVRGEDVEDAVARMRKIGAEHALSRDVVIQPQLAGRGEILIGAEISPLGPIVLFGLGGVFTEVLNDVSARRAPFTAADANDMLTEIRGHKVMTGARGNAPWDLQDLARILVAFGNFAAATSSWLESIDVNPLMVTDVGFAAVDVTCVLQQPAAD